MKRALCLMLLALTLLSGCGSAAAEPQPTAAASPWGEVQRAEAVPYVCTQEQRKAAARAEEQEPAEEAEFSSYEEFLRKLYVEKGSFYFKDWELEMFEALPQDEPYAFVPHTDRFRYTFDRNGKPHYNFEESDYIAFAEQFVEAGCEARVKKLQSVEDGTEYIHYITIVTTTPAHLWELAEDWPERLSIEQLYPEVDLRFDIPVWPAE